MQDDPWKDIEEQASLLYALKGKKQGETAYCGHEGDREKLEETLWRFAEGGLESREQAALEQHMDSCTYCTQRMWKICNILQRVEAEPGFSPGRARALLARKEEGRAGSLAAKLFQRLETLLRFQGPVWKPLTAGALALLVVGLFLTTQFRGPAPMGRIIAEANPQGVSPDMDAGQVAAVLSFCMDLPETEIVRGLLPESRGWVPARFFRLGFVWQSLDSLLWTSPSIQGDTAVFGERLAASLEESLQGLKGSGRLLEETVLFRKKLSSGLYKNQELRVELSDLKKNLSLLAGADDFKDRDAGTFFQLGSWLSLLDRDLGLQARGVDRAGDLKALFQPDYVTETREAFSRSFPPASVSGLAPEFDEMMAAAKRVQKGAPAPDSWSSVQRAVENLVRFGFGRAQSG